MEFDAIEGAAGALAGTAAAKGLDQKQGHAGEAHHNCADCGSPVTGNFCAECGQPAHVHRTLLHLGHELLHGVMHFDGRIWRTLPLLIANPGKLTREWCQGRRTSYVSPLAIFLFTLFVIFFGLTMAPKPHVDVTPTITQTQATPEDVANLKAQIAEIDKSIAENEAAFATSTGSARIALGAEKGTMAGVKATLEGRLAGLEAAVENGNTAPTTATRTDGLEPGSWQAQVADLKWDNNGKGVMASIGKKLKNPDLMVYKLQQTAYKFAFLLVPFSIPFMWLLFLWRRGFTLYDHGVFVLYSLTFMAMLLLVAVVAVTLLPALGSAIAWAVAIIIPVHMFAQLKGAYDLSFFSAAWRMMFLLVFCSIVLTLFLAAIVYLGLGH
ncbi:DUF3667 domain-containing protein [uncultured Brevundimonas sp.]|uniref:DUF3667 domain-containing protein n=1 Tax=uncultured Brevundimonas sp. TaxID=213418 RepID=UPI00260313C2|nr:DUF3667 domain-containing protein [uncultured Brevundimonas sp.]